MCVCRSLCTFCNSEFDIPGIIKVYTSNIPKGDRSLPLLAKTSLMLRRRKAGFRRSILRTHLGGGGGESILFYNYSHLGITCKKKGGGSDST